jgi:dihydrofolate synthase/folylpolyglutamate synthase
MEKLHLRINPNKVIVVAGTNGKGSTCATLQTLLIAAGKQVGFFSSPHLVRINERIRLNGKNISNPDFRKVFNKIHSYADDLSHFEYLTLIAVYYFFELKNVDFAVFEVGLGGTLDAVNAIPHNISVITKLGFDHEKTLGYSLPEIASNKFGIISSNNKVFHSKFYDSEVKELAEKISFAQFALLVEAFPYDCEVDVSGKYPVFFIKTPFGKFKMNLQGERAAENTALAITVFDYLVGRQNTSKFLPAISKVKWPGRMQKISYKGRDIFLSGDHNPQGIKSLCDILEFYNFEKVHFVIGVCNDKKHNEMLEQLANIDGSCVYLTETPEKTLPVLDYDEKFRKLAKFISSNPIETLETALSAANRNDLIVVTGSLYLVGKILKSFRLSLFINFIIFYIYF